MTQRISDERLRALCDMGPNLTWMPDYFHAAHNLRDARQRIAVLEEALTDMRSGWRYIRRTHGDLPGVGWDRCEQSATAALSPPKSPEGVTERPVPEPPLPPPNISATTGKPWKKAWEKTFEAPAPVGLTLEEQREIVMMLDEMAGVGPLGDIEDRLAKLLSRPSVAAMLQASTGGAG